MTRQTAAQGFAVALLLWMIAGMSLTVAAVLHFARADTSMVELRIREAKSRAIGRGAAMLALRDRAISAYLLEDSGGESVENSLRGEGETKEDGKFGSRYEFIQGWSVTVTIRPSNGYVSLNDAEASTLEKLFVELGGMDPPDASRMAQGVVDYRYMYPGFRYHEELLAVEGVSRQAYDRIKEYVHPFRSGQLNGASAPSALSKLITQDTAAADSSENVANPDSEATPGGLVTFESVAAKIEQRAGVSDTTIIALEMKHEIDGGVKLKQQIWASPERLDPVLRIGAISIQESVDE